MLDIGEWGIYYFKGLLHGMRKGVFCYEKQAYPDIRSYVNGIYGFYGQRMVIF